MSRTHGMASTYQDGCRCGECRANTGQARLGRAQRAHRTPPDDAHGKVATYTNWTCRCEACTTANSDPSYPTT